LSGRISVKHAYLLAALFDDIDFAVEQLLIIQV